MATNKHAPTRFWLSWFGSVPHLGGALLAFVVTVGALVGALETVLRLRFHTWWWVAVVAAYGAGWLLTVLVMRLVSVIGRRRWSWKSIVYPDTDATAEAWLAGKQTPLRRWRLIATAVAASALGIVLFAFGMERANLVASILGLVAALLSFATAVVDSRRG